MDIPAVVKTLPSWDIITQYWTETKKKVVADENAKPLYGDLFEMLDDGEYIDEERVGHELLALPLASYNKTEGVITQCRYTRMDELAAWETHL